MTSLNKLVDVSEETVRWQIEMAPDQEAELKQLMAECRIRTKKDLINNALTIFLWAVEQRRAGRVVASLDESNMRYKELQMPTLNAVKQRSAAIA